MCNLKLLGHCALSREQIKYMFAHGDIERLCGLQGEYVIVIDNDSDCWIITSPNDVIGYFYCMHNSKLYHGDSVVEVFKNSGLAWDWNYKALADMFQLDHVLGDETLHTKIHRVPAGSILHYNGNVRIHTPGTFQPLFRHRGNCSAPKEASDAFNEELATSLGNDHVVMSMSAGFDSRVILGGLLSHDCNPTLLTMGSSRSTDVTVAEHIANSIGLDILTVSLEAEDYLNYGHQIVEITNGTSKAWNWHTYVYLEKANLGNTPLYVGTNGEFARSHYLDYGIISRILEFPSYQKLVTPYREFIHALWLRRLGKSFNAKELAQLNSQFRKELVDEEHNHSHHICDLSSSYSLPAGLDRFYLEQRVRCSMGNGIRIHLRFTPVRTPFLSRKWISIIWNLPRYWKTGNRWHRFYLKENYPRLLDFQEQGRRNNMRDKPPTLYWVPLFNRSNVIPFANYREWFRQDLICDFICSNRQILSDLVSPRLVADIINEHREQGNRLNAVAFLLTMVFWILNIRR